MGSVVASSRSESCTTMKSSFVLSVVIVFTAVLTNAASPPAVRGRFPLSMTFVSLPAI